MKAQKSAGVFKKREVRKHLTFHVIQKPGGKEPRKTKEQRPRSLKGKKKVQGLKTPGEAYLEQKKKKKKRGRKRETVKGRSKGHTKTGEKNALW